MNGDKIDANVDHEKKMIMLEKKKKKGKRSRRNVWLFVVYTNGMRRDE